MLLETLTISILVIQWGGKILPQSILKGVYNTSLYFFRSSQPFQCFPLLMHLRLMLYLPISESKHVTFSCDSHFFLILPESALQNQDISAFMGCGGEDLLNQSEFLYFQKFYTSRGWAGPTELDRNSLFPGILHF